MVRTRLSTLGLSLTGCLLAATVGAYAEVSVVDTGDAPLPDGSTPPPLMIIVDDSDPFSVWAPQHIGVEHIRMTNTEGAANQDGPPSLLVHPTTGIPMVAWAKNSPSGYDVVITVYEDGAWSSPEIVADHVESAFDPVVTADPTTGVVHIVYWIDGPTSRVVHREAPADLSAWSVERDVSAPGIDAVRPSAAVFDGVLRVAYERHNFGNGTSPREIVLSRYEGGAFVPEVVALTHQTGDLAVEVHGTPSTTGRLWVDWIDSTTEMGWARWDPATGWGAVQTEPYATIEERDWLIRGLIRKKAHQ